MTEQSTGGAAAPPTTTQLAVTRTRLALDRTMMAWVRTATSLITFGFTVYKFFQYMQDRGERPRADHLLGPREFGMMMIVIGLATLLMATIQNRRTLKTIEAHSAGGHYSLAEALAALISVLGILALLTAIFRQ
ncbi:MAG: YidH family protein [Pyrinomonadaceae bacterium]